MRCGIRDDKGENKMCVLLLCGPASCVKIGYYPGRNGACGGAPEAVALASMCKGLIETETDLRWQENQPVNMMIDKGHYSLRTE